MSEMKTINWYGSKKIFGTTSKLINVLLHYDYKSAFFILIKILENSNIDYYREFSKMVNLLYIT